MKKTILLLGIFITCLCYAQEDKADLEFQNYLSEFRNFHFEKLKAKKFEYITINPQEYRQKSSKGIVRMLDFEVKEEIYTIILGYNDSAYYLFKQYRLYVLRNSTEIIGIISVEKFTKKEEKNVYFNEKEINNFIDKHNSFYNTNTSQSNLIEDLTKEVEYGYCLDNHILDSRDRRQKVMDKFGDKFNSSDFRKLLSSYNAELQTFGVDGLEVTYDGLYMNTTKEQKTQKIIDLEIIRHIKDRNSLLQTCNRKNTTVF